MNPVAAPVKPATAITDTGLKGFLLWYKREQPAIYNKIAPQLPKLVPKAFANYNSDYRRGLGRTNNQKKVQKILRSAPFNKNPGLSNLSDYDTSYFSDATPISIDPISIDPIDVGTIDYGSTPTFNEDTGSYSYTSPVANAATTSISSPPTIAAIGQVIGAASQVFLTNNQAQLQQSVLQTQLQRAQAGLPPLNTSLNQLGVPTISTGGSLGNSGTLLLIAAAIGLVALTAGKKS